VMLSSPEKLTVSIALASLGAGSLRIPYGLLMVGSFFTIFPTLILYLVFRKSFNSALTNLTSQ
jgi:ABC-type glycerol-3-phosphate transport system permease component